jgi:hypothetical protein
LISLVFAVAASLNLVCESLDPDQRVFVSIEGAEGQIKVPRSRDPIIATSSEDGWRPMKELRITDTEISGKFSYSLMSHPLVQIDRITGNIEVSSKIGGYGFRGTCKPLDTQDRKF